MPIISRFINSNHYNATFFHELAHLTKTKATLNRNVGKYAEEVVADMTAHLICNELGIDKTETKQNNMAYIKSWGKSLAGNNALLIKSVAAWEEAARYILDMPKPAYEN